MKRWVFILLISFVLLPVHPQDSGIPYDNLTLNHHFDNESEVHLVFVYCTSVNLHTDPMIAVISSYCPRRGVLGHILSVSVPVIAPDPIVSLRSRVESRTYDVLPVQTAICVDDRRFLIKSFYTLTPEMYEALLHTSSVSLTLRGHYAEWTIHDADYLAQLETAVNTVTSELIEKRTLTREFTDLFGEYVTR